MKVKQEEVIQLLHQLNIDGKDIRFIENLYWNQRVVVKVAGDTADHQDIQKIVLQGYVMSPDLFNV